MRDLGKLIFTRVSYIYLCLLIGMDKLRFKVAEVVYKSVKKRHLADGIILCCWIISFSDKASQYRKYGSILQWLAPDTTHVYVNVTFPFTALD